MLKQSQNRTKRAALRPASRIEHAGQHHRLVGDEAHRASFDAAKTDDDVAGKRLLDLEEIALIDDLVDQLLHVIGLVGIGWHQRIERHLEPLAVIDSVGQCGTRRVLDDGRKSMSRRICSSASRSLSKALSAIEDLSV